MYSEIEITREKSALRMNGSRKSFISSLLLKNSFLVLLTLLNFFMMQVMFHHHTQLNTDYIDSSESREKQISTFTQMDRTFKERISPPGNDRNSINEDSYSPAAASRSSRNEESYYMQSLWKGEQILEEDIIKQLPSIVDVVVTYCHDDFTSYIDELDAMLPVEVKTLNFVIMSKCGNEDLIENIMNERLKFKFQHDIGYTIHPLVNKGGCDLGIAHYINNFFKTEGESTAREKVIFFLKDGPRTKENFHVSTGKWRSLESMWSFASKGRFICGIEISEKHHQGFVTREILDGQLRKKHTQRFQIQSVYHQPAALNRFIIKNYSRFNDPKHVSSGPKFTRGYESLKDFLDGDLNMKFPPGKPVEVCYGGTFALSGAKLFAKKRELENAIFQIEKLLLEGEDITVIEHFLERIWAWMLSRQMKHDEINPFMQMQDVALRNGAYAKKIKEWSNFLKPVKG